MSVSRQMRQVEAIANGTVIDHIPPAACLQVVDLVASPDDTILIGINFKSASLGRKGVVKIDERELDEETISRLALVAPRVTLSIIRDYRVHAKRTVPVPRAFRGIARCPNPNCITNHERCTTIFEVTISEPDLAVRCVYCERDFAGRDLVIT